MTVFTSYFAKAIQIPSNIIPIAISIYQPAGTRMLKYPQLAPTRSILTAWKQNEDQNQYVRDFNLQVLAELDPQQVYEDLKVMSQGKDVALICYEGPSKFCHRHLVAKWLEGAGISVGGEIKF